MPTTAPEALTSGPPELPGFTAASNWIRPPSSVPRLPRPVRSSPDTIPLLTLHARPSGVPIATTSSPTSTPPPIAAGTTTDGRERGVRTAMSREVSADAICRRGGGAVGEPHAYVAAPVDDVIGGQDVAARIRDHAGADPVLGTHHDHRRRHSLRDLRGGRRCLGGLGAGSRGGNGVRVPTSSEPVRQARDCRQRHENRQANHPVAAPAQVSNFLLAHAYGQYARRLKDRSA